MKKNSLVRRINMNESITNQKKELPLQTYKEMSLILR